MYKAWDGAANRNTIQGQFPYILSGGLVGLALVITGGVLLMLATIRAERQVLTNRFDEMALLLSRNLNRMQISSTNGAAGAGEQVIAGKDVYHRPDCKILQGKKNLTALSVEQAAAEGLSPCRACGPPEALPAEDATKTEVAPAAAASTPGASDPEETATAKPKRGSKADKAASGASEKPSP